MENPIENTPTPEPTPNTPEPATYSPEPTPKKSSWVASFLRWSLIILVAFGLGALFMALVFHLPLQQNYRQVSSDLEDANAQVAELSGQVEQLTKTNADLQQALEDNSLKQAIYGGLAEVRAARMAIAADDPAGARLAVTQAIQSLDTLATLIDPTNSDIVTNLQDKANQANSDLQTGLTAALPALDQLDKNLVSFLNTLFPTP